MGKITSGGMEDVKIKVRRSAGGSPCSAELVGYLACLDANSGNEASCVAARQALGQCMEVAMSSGLNRRRHKMPVNYHLQQVRLPSHALRCSGSLVSSPTAH